MAPDKHRKGFPQWMYRWEVPTRRRTLWERLTPPQLFVLSFLFLILGGTVGLRLIPGLYTGEPLSWLNALFTATSAVCVTGLIVVDTATYFTTMGQGFILLLIQLGGLGIVTFTTLIIVALGRRLSLRHQALSPGAAEVSPHVDFRRLARAVVILTLVIEALGALCLYLLWAPRFGWGAAAWHAVFQSVSAFCNAGFSTFSDSLVGFAGSPLSLLVVAGLIVLGGIGFLTLEELNQRRRAHQEGRPFALSLHSRLVLAMTLGLLLAGTAGYLVFEWNVTLGGMPVMDRVVNALFMSSTARTAGFNTVDYARASDSANFLTILLMSIGGSPGSTAGGLKTTTFGLIMLLAWSRIRGREDVHAWGRSVPPETLSRAIGLMVVGFGVLTLGIFLLTAAELSALVHAARVHGQFLAHMFEAASAFNTVGLSLGATSDLSTGGRWVIILLMFVGRVGPLAFAAAITRSAERRKTRVRYAYEDVVVG